MSTTSSSTASAGAGASATAGATVGAGAEETKKPELQRQPSTQEQEFVDVSKLEKGATCGLCLEEFKNDDKVIRLLRCKKNTCLFHKCCGFEQSVGQYVEQNKVCPSCRVFYGVKRGNMPDGKMTITRHSSSLEGHEGCGTIEINFEFEGGTQGPEHYQPGKPYSSDSRTAYLPDSKEGNEILKLFQEAWDRKIMFTIGYSLTRQADGVIIYNSIHHKTSQTGGPTSHGYPDETYLMRVREELRAHGIE